MANRLYTAFREDMLDSSAPNLAVATIKAILHDNGADTPDPTNDDFLNDVAPAARIAVSGAFTSVSVTGGVFDAADVTYTSVSGASVETIIIYEDDGGVEANSSLIAHIDTATGLPFTPSGGNVTIQWDNGANRIFKIGAGA